MVCWYNFQPDDIGIYIIHGTDPPRLPDNRNPLTFWIYASDIESVIEESRDSTCIYLFPIPTSTYGKTNQTVTPSPLLRAVLSGIHHPTDRVVSLSGLKDLTSI